MKKRNRFAVWLWLILGFIGGIIIGGSMAMNAGYSIPWSILCCLGGGLAGALILTAFMGIHYMMYRADLFSKD